MGCGNFSCIVANTPGGFAMACLGTPLKVRALLGDTQLLSIPWAPAVRQALCQELAELDRDTSLLSGGDAGPSQKQQAPPELGEGGLADGAGSLCRHSSS